MTHNTHICETSYKQLLSHIFQGGKGSLQSTNIETLLSGDFNPALDNHFGALTVELTA